MARVGRRTSRRGEAKRLKRVWFVGAGFTTAVGYRVLDLVDNQVRSLRKRLLIDSYKSGTRQGACWGIRTNIADYWLTDPLDCPLDLTKTLAETPTRLKRMDDELQERLINWGYAVCDAALRKHVKPQLMKPSDFPYPTAKV